MKPLKQYLQQINFKQLFKRIGLIAVCALTGILVVLGTMFAFGVFWMFRTWNNLTMEGLVSTFLLGAGGADNGLWISGILNIALPAAIALAVYILILIRLFHRNQKNHRSIHIWNSFIAGISILAILSNLWMTWERLDILNYLKDQQLIEDDRLKEGELSFIDANYVDPKSVVITAPEEKRNLIMIFLESMENTYSDFEHGGAFADNYIPKLTELSLENENFNGEANTLNGGNVMPYSTWTMGGLYAHTSGLPLNITIGGNEMNSQNSFLPSITTLGDILNQNGYQQVFQCGSSGDFAGRDLYFRTHGNYEIHDINYSYETGELEEGYHVFWGYEDAKLFEFAKNHILKLAAENQPFNYTMLTVDTHFEDGYVCQNCENIYDENQYANVITCSDQKVTDFVKWIQSQDFYENTTIVLIGDHLTMDSDFCNSVDTDYNRTVYTNYINSAIAPENDTHRDYMTKDTFPTVLASLGFQIEGDRLALGTNLFSNRPTLIEEFGYEEVEQGITMHSDLISKINKGIDIEANQKMYPEHESSISVSLYDLNSNTFRISASYIDCDTGIQLVQFALYLSGEEISPGVPNAYWFDAELQPDGSYSADIPLDLMNFSEKECHIDTYIIDDNGEAICVNAKTVNIAVPIQLPAPISEQ